MTFVTGKLEEISLPHHWLSHYTLHQDRRLVQKEWICFLAAHRTARKQIPDCSLSLWSELRGKEQQYD